MWRGNTAYCVKFSGKICRIILIKESVGLRNVRIISHYLTNKVMSQ